METLVTQEGCIVKTVYLVSNRVKFVELLASTGISFFISVDPQKFPIEYKKGKTVTLYKTSDAFEKHFDEMKSFLASIPQKLGNADFGGISVSGDFLVSQEGTWTPSEEISKRDLSPIANFKRIVEEAEDVAGIMATAPVESSSESSEEDYEIVRPGEKFEVILDDKKNLKEFLSKTPKRSQKSKRHHDGYHRRRRTLPEINGIDEVYSEMGILLPVIPLAEFFKLSQAKSIVDKITNIKTAIDIAEKSYLMNKMGRVDAIISEIRDKIVDCVKKAREAVSVLEAQNVEIESVMKRSQTIIDRKLPNNREQLEKGIQESRAKLRTNVINIARIKENSKSFLNSHIEALQEIAML